MFSHRQGAQRSTSPIDQCDTGILPELRKPWISLSRPNAVRTKSQLNKQAKHTTFSKFEVGISFAEHGKLVAESSKFHLTLKRAHRLQFFQLEIRQKSGTF